MIELEHNTDRASGMLGNLEEEQISSPNDFLLDTLRTSTPRDAGKIYETFCKTITVGFWDHYKRIGVPRNIANNQASMLIADIAYGLRPTEEDTDQRAYLKRKAIHRLIEARSRVLPDTRHMNREADKFADVVLYIIGRVEKEESKEKIVKFPVDNTPD